MKVYTKYLVASVDALKHNLVFYIGLKMPISPTYLGYKVNDLSEVVDNVPGIHTWTARERLPLIAHLIGLRKQAMIGVH